MPSPDAAPKLPAHHHHPGQRQLQREVSAVRQEAIDALRSWESGGTLSPTAIRCLRKRLQTCQRRCALSPTQTPGQVGDGGGAGASDRQPPARSGRRRRMKSSASTSPPLSGYMGWMKTRPSAIQSLANISLAAHESAR